jgi:DNA-binding NtrC family response regulator
VPYAETKSLEISALRRSLTPCILDEDPEQLRLLSQMILEMGYEALPTADPERALRLVQSGASRLILVDVEVPLPASEMSSTPTPEGSCTPRFERAAKRDAYEFLDRLVRVDPGVHVIIISKDYTLDSALETIRRGAADFLPKPVNEQRLKRALDDFAAFTTSAAGYAPSRNRRCAISNFTASWAKVR